MLRKALNDINETIDALAHEVDQDSSPVTADEFLHAAKFSDLATIQRYIAENCTNPSALNVCNPAGCSALLLAINSISTENADVGRNITKALISAGIDVNIRNSSLTSPLLAAVCCGNIHVLADLLTAKDIDLIPQAYHETPLLRAARACNTEAVKLLLQAGAYIEDTNERQYLQDYLSEYSKQRKFREIVKLIKEHNETNRRQHFLGMLDKRGYTLNEIDSQRYVAMSNNKYLWFKEIVRALDDNKQLNSKSLAVALHRVTYKLPVIAESRITEDKTPGAPRITINAGRKLVTVKSRELKKSPLLTAAYAADMETVKRLLLSGEYVESYQDYKEQHSRKKIHRDIIKLFKAHNEPNKRQSFIHGMSDAGVNIDESDAAIIHELSMYHFHQLKDAVNQQAGSKKLTAGDVSDIMNDIRFKTLSSRSNTPEPGEKSPAMIKMTLDTGPELYTERVPHVGERRTGFLDPSTARPSYLVKKTASNQSLKATRKASSNEVSALHLLGRNNAQWGTHKRHAVVISTHEGHVPLAKLGYFEIQKLAFDRKLQMLTSALSDLNRLHEHQLYHGDIGTHSFGVNLESGHMRLIDCASTHKVHPKHKRESRPFRGNGFFIDHHWQMTQTLAHDMLMMGELIASRLFIQYSLQNDTPTTQYAIKTLISAMTEPAPANRCTSEQALEFCKLLRHEGDQMTIERVEEIAQSTINRTTCTVEDVLRECVRAKIFN